VFDKFCRLDLIQLLDSKSAKQPFIQTPY